MTDTLTLPKVLVGAPCGKQPVFRDFFLAFYTALVPDARSSNMIAAGGSVPKNLNLLVDEAVRQECTHLFIVEDDSVFEADTILRLLAHDKPVVAGLCRQRNPPFLPYVYAGIDLEQGTMSWRTLMPKDTGLIGPADGVVATGMGGILINMAVFTKLERPYFRHYFIGERECGQDIVFARSLIDAGIEVWCDLDVTIWHMTQCVIGSVREADGWRAVVRIDDAAFNIKVD